MLTSAAARGTPRAQGREADVERGATTKFTERHSPKHARNAPNNASPKRARTRRKVARAAYRGSSNPG